jgi:hypothetical protein
MRVLWINVAAERRGDPQVEWSLVVLPGGRPSMDEKLSVAGGSVEKHDGR